MSIPSDAASTQQRHEAERLLVACALLDPDTYHREHAAGTRASMFSSPPLAGVWRAIGATLEAGEPPTLVRFAAHLPDDTGYTVADLAELHHAEASTVYARYHGHRVREAYAIHELELLPEGLRALEPGARLRRAAHEVRRLADLASAQRIDVHREWCGAAPPREWICEGWLGYRLTLFTGHGGRGKSRLALQLAAGIAGGARGSWLPPQPDSATTVPSAAAFAIGGASVLVASWEDERDELHRRLEKMGADDRLPWAAPDRLGNRLAFADLAGYGPLWEATDAGGQLTETGAELRAIAERIAARLLIIDPRAAAYAGDENSRAHVRAFISDWDRWAREKQCAVLLVDHLPKYATGANRRNTEISYAGSTDWHNAARSVWTLEPGGNGTTVLRCDKSNYGPAPPEVTLRSGDGCAWFATEAANDDDEVEEFAPGEIAK